MLWEREKKKKIHESEAVIEAHGITKPKYRRREEGVHGKGGRKGRKKKEEEEEEEEGEVTLSRLFMRYIYVCLD